MSILLQEGMQLQYLHITAIRHAAAVPADC